MTWKHRPWISIKIFFEEMMNYNSAYCEYLYFSSDINNWSQVGGIIPASFVLTLQS